MSEVKPLHCPQSPLCAVTRMTWEGMASHVQSSHLGEMLDEARRQSEEFARAHRVTQKFLRETEFTI